MVDEMTIESEERSMESIILMAETGADIPPELARQHNIQIVPMHVSFGNISQDDGTFPSEEICAYYERTKQLPKTSGSTPEDFSIAFDYAHARWPDAQILYLAYSAVTTCSYQSAQIAAEGRDYVTSLDTKMASAGQYAVVIRMARLLEEHREWTVAEAAAAARDLIKRARMCFIPKDMEYLRAGGRVSNAVALCGKLLGIHPLIEFQNGYLVATKKLRGKWGRIIPQLVCDYSEQRDLEKDEIWLIYSPGFSEEFRSLAEQATRSCGFQKITWVKTGGVITTHGGPGAFGVVGFSR